MSKEIYDKILGALVKGVEPDIENVESLGYVNFKSTASSSINMGGTDVNRVYVCEDTIHVPNQTDFSADVLIIGGGGGGGSGQGGGGGGGGYREFTKKYYKGTSYTVTVGAGGSVNSNGSDSSIEKIGNGGGAGGSANGATQEACNGKDGGSGGGSGLTTNQSFRKTYSGNSLDTRCNGSSQGYPGEPGPLEVLSSGGAGGTGSNFNGGPGKTSNITGASVGRGGGGACGFGSGTATDGGGNPYSNGTVNTGGGGGGGGGNGGSGFVCIKFPDTITITIDWGLSYTSYTSDGYTTVQFIAGTGTISFNSAGGGSSEYLDTLLLYPFDSDANDASSTGNNLTLTNASIDTSVKKYGAGSLKFTGSVANGKAQGVMPSLGTGDFTIEFWLYMASMSSNQYILDRGQGSNFSYDSPGFALFTTTSSRFSWMIKDSYDSEEGAYLTSLQINSSSLSSAIGSWVHVALVRQGTIYRMYIDGTQEASGAGSATDFTQHNFAIGDAMVNGGGVFQNSYVDDFRLSSTSVYPDGTTFTVPSAAHPTS